MPPVIGGHRVRRPPRAVLDIAASSSSARLLQPLPDGALVGFARPQPRHVGLVPHVDASGHLVGGDLLAGASGDVVGVEGAAVRGHQHRGDLLAELGVGQPEHERVEHFVELLFEEQLDLAGRDVGTARLHHLGRATHEPRATVVQEHAVTGVEPAVGVEHVGAFLLVVAVHEPVAADPQLALLAVGDVDTGVGIDDAVSHRRDVADGLAHPAVRGDAGHGTAHSATSAGPTVRPAISGSVRLAERRVVAHRLQEGRPPEHVRRLGPPR